MPYGYNGRILRINLGNGSIGVEEPGEKFYRRYLGGRGFISYFLLKELPKNVEPLSEDNRLIFATSVMTGAPIPGFGRHSVGARSPLTGAYGESEAGGYWGVELKFAGYDAIIVEGKSPKPVYIWITNDTVEIRDASHLWGKDTGETKDILIKELGDDKIKTLSIGIAGENLVRFAGIASDLSHYHGRTGMGAVMGSKNLKSVVVRGKNRLKFADEEKLKQFGKYFVENMKNNADNRALSKYGTSSYTFGANAAGGLPTRNFYSGHIELEYTVDELHDKLKIKTDGCYACPVRCKQVFEAKEPYSIDPRFGGPEYETMGALGSCCGVTSMYGPAKGHELCNRYGLDTISTGLTISFAMECYENGLITKEDTGGIELKFGNMEAMFKIIEMIANREGFGNILAEGSARAARIIGKGAEKYSMTSKGQEFALCEPRVKFGVGFAYAVSPTGADHLQHEHDGAFDPLLTGYSHSADDPDFFMKGIYALGVLEPVESLSLKPEKIHLFTNLQHYWSLFDCLDLCIFVFGPVRTFKASQLADMVSAVTGWEPSLYELMKAGERATTMMRCFNIINGFTRKDDTIPDRMFEGIAGGALKGSKLDREEFERALTYYYEMMGWDRQTGVPLEGKLYDLEIGWVLDRMKQ